MKLHLFTIALDAMPFITTQLAMFNRLKCDWKWSVAEGAAMNIHDTAWCKPQPPRLSNDGTTEFLNSLRGHPRIRVVQNTSWRGKVEMVNACVAQFDEPGILMQVDADEIWLPDQLESVLHFFKAYPEIQSAKFFCRYFVGNNIIITSRNTYGNNTNYEWLRAWRYTPGMTYSRHEPPVLNGATGLCATCEQTEEVGLVFDHYGYVNENQVAYKERFYGYRDAVKHWKRLQENKEWPVKLKNFLPWIKDEATADLLHKP